MDLKEDELATLLQRYEDGSASEEERRLLEQWYQQLDVADGMVWASAEQEEASKARMYTFIHQDARMRRPGHPGRHGLLIRMLRIAAVLLPAVALIWLIRHPHGDHTVVAGTEALRTDKNIAVQHEPAPAIHMLTARSGKKDLVKTLLPDGSTAWLNTASVLKYPEKFGGAERVVEVMAGEVFFNVAKDGAHPFRVRTGSIVTTVLGTSFLVRQSFEKNTLEISVKTGAVKVEKTNEYGASALVGRNLSPGDRLRLDTAANTYQLKKIAVDGIAAFLQGRLIYDDARLEEIAYDLGRKYGVSIHFGNDKLKDARYRISFDDMPLKDALLILATLTGTHIEKDDQGKYIIK